MAGWALWQPMTINLDTGLHFLANFLHGTIRVMSMTVGML